MRKSNNRLLLVIIVLFSVLSPEVGAAPTPVMRYDRVTIVFIPGIYGSTLEDVAENSFWGENGIGPYGLSLVDHPDLIPELFENVRFSIGVFGKTVKGYSGIHHNARHLAGRALVFPYDWRKSNKTSAAELDKFLCRELPDIDPTKRIVFVAHSMGGLVLRHWIKDFIDGANGTCSGLGIEHIDRFVFAGTPHVGSMEPVITLFSGKTALETNPIYSSLFTGGMAGDAVTFESAYELMPADNIAGPQCSGTRSDRVMYLSKDIGTGSNIPIYLDSLQSWKNFNLPKELPSGTSIEQLWPLIEKRLKTASSVVCELLTYNAPPSVVAKMNFIVGELRDRRSDQGFAVSTADRIVVTALPNRDPELKLAKAKGDGTVPYWSAEPQALGMFHFSSFPQSTNQPHESILDDIEIVSHLQRVVDNAALDVAWLSEKPFEIDIEDKNAWLMAKREFVKRPLEQISPEVYAASINYLSERANAIGITGLEIYRDTKQYSGGDKVKNSAVGYALAASVGTGLNKQSLIWANQNSTIALHKIGNQSLAVASAIRTGQVNIAVENGLSSADEPGLAEALADVEAGWRSVAGSHEAQKFDPGLANVLSQSEEFDPALFDQPQFRAYNFLSAESPKGPTEIDS
ncbi:esterase/lipase family protein [Hoeflea sp.]|uniref:esterase/lipase family protein n=1 Tax=Hoeflea sp. TaxID=1940281 RepID=UPI003748F40A